MQTAHIARKGGGPLTALWDYIAVQLLFRQYVADRIQLFFFIFLFVSINQKHVPTSVDEH